MRLSARYCDFDVIVEIGTHFGGTLACWAELTRDRLDALVIGIDLPCGEGGPAEWGGLDRDRSVRRNDRVEQQYPHVRNILGNSQHASTVNALLLLLDGRAIDFLFIDGDHTYPGVSTDYTLYAPLVRPGGVIAFHDVNPCIKATQQSFAVPEFFDSLRGERAVFSVNADWGGIGALRVPSPATDF